MCVNRTHPTRNRWHPTAVVEAGIPGTQRDARVAPPSTLLDRIRAVNTDPSLLVLLHECARILHDPCVSGAEAADLGTAWGGGEGPGKAAHLCKYLRARAAVRGALTSMRIDAPELRSREAVLTSCAAFSSSSLGSACTSTALGDK